MTSGVLLRTDASTGIGTGHSMRCLALAEACNEVGLKVAIATASMPENLVGRWRAEDVAPRFLSERPGSTADADATAALLSELNCTWVVVDGYDFGLAYQERLKRHGCKVLLIDDEGGADCYCADVILNQNAYADDSKYLRRGAPSRLLLGLRYLMLRREFRALARLRHRSIPPKASNILITMGGADPDNATLAILSALRSLGARPIKAVVVLGGSNPYAAVLTSIVETFPFRIELVRDVTCMSTLMLWADCAVAAAGTTAWELAYMGVPFMAVTIADNQVKVAASLQERRLAINLGAVRDLDPEKLAQEMSGLIGDQQTRAQMSEKGQRAVDDQGALRVLQAIGMLDIRLSLAGPADARMLWEWANDASVRGASFSTDEISWEHHERWYNQQLADPGVVIWIAYAPGDQAIGQIRFRCQGADAVDVGISVIRPWRGKGYGRQMIDAGLREVARVFPGRIASAFVRRENSASIGAFTSAGFSLLGEQIVDGIAALRFVRNAC